MPGSKRKWPDPQPPADLATAIPGSEHIGEKILGTDDAIWTIVAVEQEDLGDIRTRRYVMERNAVVTQRRVTEDYRRGHRV